MGDNCGYWIGRGYGQTVVARYGQGVGLTPERIEKTRGFLVRYGPVGVFGSRFITGLRFLAGPLAGSADLPPLPFVIANVLGALIYLPLQLGKGTLWTTGSASMWLASTVGLSGWGVLTRRARRLL